MSQHSARGRLWQSFRDACIRRAGYKCERCGRAGRFEVHHKRNVSRGGKKFDMNNVEVLCRDCHLGKHRSRDPVRAEWQAMLGDL